MALATLAPMPFRSPLHNHHAASTFSALTAAVAHAAVKAKKPKLV